MVGWRGRQASLRSALTPRLLLNLRFVAAIHPVILSSQWWQHVIPSTTASRKTPAPCWLMLPWAWVKRGARPPVHSQEVGPPASLGKPMLTYLVPELPAQHSARRRLATPLLLSQGANQSPVKTHADISARMTPISTNSLLPIPTCSQPQTLTIDPHVAPRPAVTCAFLGLAQHML